MAGLPASCYTFTSTSPHFFMWQYSDQAVPLFKLVVSATAIWEPNYWARGRKWVIPIPNCRIASSKNIFKPLRCCKSIEVNLQSTVCFMPLSETFNNNNKALISYRRRNVESNSRCPHSRWMEKKKKWSSEEVSFQLVLESLSSFRCQPRVLLTCTQWTIKNVTFYFWL